MFQEGKSFVLYGVESDNVKEELSTYEYELHVYEL